MTINETPESTTDVMNQQPVSNIAPSDMTDDQLKNAIDNLTKTDTNDKSIDNNNKINHDSQKESDNTLSEHYNNVYNELKSMKENDQTFKVEVKSIITGGFKAQYKELPVFLPFAQFSMNREIDENEKQDAIGKEYEVKIYEMKEDEYNRKTVVVTHKKILSDEFWKKYKINDTVECTVISIANFGVFVDVDGIEGLIYRTRLSDDKVDNIEDFAKKGDKITARIVEIKKNEHKLGLSCRTPQKRVNWSDIAEKYAVGTTHKMKISRFVDFGIFIDVEKGVSALLRISEIDWAIRIINPKNMFKIGDEIEVVVINLNKDKRIIEVSKKQVSENPWKSFDSKYDLESVYKGKISEINGQGIVVDVNNEVTGFIPRSRVIEKINEQPVVYQVGNDIDVKIIDLNTEKQNLILKPYFEGVEDAVVRPRPERNKFRSDRPKSNFDKQREENSNMSSPSSEKRITLGELISDKMKDSLLKK